VKTITIILWALTLAAATMHLAVYAADNKNAAMVALAEANTCDCSQSMYEYKADLIKVVDGDTIDVDVDLGFSVHTRQRLRYARVDAWETRGAEREKGLVAKQFLIDLIAGGKGLMVRTVKDKQGKYGRYLAEVFVVTDRGLINTNDALLTGGHAVLYGEK
jgi:micrococcal nuclease